MKKSKFIAWVMAITLVLAPGAAAYADETGNTTPTTDPAPTKDPAPAPTDPTTPTPDDTGTVCPQQPSDDDAEPSDDDTDQNDDAADNPKEQPPAPQMSDRNGYKDMMDKFKDSFKDHNNRNNNGDHDDDHHKDDKNHHDEQGDREDNNGSQSPTCYKHDNGKHKGWTHKISNMLKRLDQLKQEADSLQRQLDRLKEWAKTNGSTSDLDALNQILEALNAKDEAGEADGDDLIVLAETQDQLNDTAGSVQTLEKALTTNYTDDNVYKLLSSKLVKSGQKGVKVYVKGKKPQFDVQPLVVDGRTLVPFRAIGDALQAQVQWDPATQSVILTNKDGKVVKLQIGNKQATVDGKPVSLEVPATVVAGRTLVPLRALADFFNLEVNWDNAAEMAILK